MTAAGHATTEAEKVLRMMDVRSIKLSMSSPGKSIRRSPHNKALWNRAVRVFIDAPSLDGLDVSTLARRAQLSPSKKITHGAVTVKVEPFGR